VLVQAMLMLAGGGGEACADIEHLRSQSALFGSVGSDSTLYRTFRSIGPEVLDRLWEAMAEVRAGVWRRAVATTGTAPVVLDIDGSLHQIHSENKVDAAANYKGGYGFHPMYCFADATGETLAVTLRPGNAGANSIADHVALLDAAIAQLPAEIALGHRLGDDAGLVARAVQVRTDSAGCTDFVWHARARNVGFAVGARSNASIHAALSRVAYDSEAWPPALRQDGDERPGAAVAELTCHLDLSAWPSGTRLIVRREPLHPGAQQSLFPSTTFRYWGHYTDAAGSPVDLDVHMRAHAHVENNIRRLKDSGAQRFPFTGVFCGPDADSLPTTSDAVAWPNFREAARRSRSSALIADQGVGLPGEQRPGVGPARRGLALGAGTAQGDLAQVANAGREHLAHQVEQAEVDHGGPPPCRWRAPRWAGRSGCPGFRRARRPPRTG